MTNTVAEEITKDNGSLADSIKKREIGLPPFNMCKMASVLIPESWNSDEVGLVRFNDDEWKGFKDFAIKHIAFVLFKYAREGRIMMPEVSISAKWENPGKAIEFLKGISECIFDDSVRLMLSHCDLLKVQL